MLIGLRQDGRAGLLQNAGAGQLAGLGRDVGVADAAFGSREVLLRDPESGDGRDQPALEGAESPSGVRDVRDRRGEHAECGLGRALRGGRDGGLAREDARERAIDRVEADLGVAAAVEADLHRHRRTGAQELHAVEGGGVGDAADFRQELRELLLDGATLRVADRARRGLGGELREAGEDVGHLAERLLTDRQRGDAVVGVADRLGGDAHVALELIGDREAGGVVGGVVDAEPGRQPLERRGEAVAGLVQVALRVERGQVRVDCDRHRLRSSLKVLFAGWSIPRQVFLAARLIGRSPRGLEATAPPTAAAMLDRMAVATPTERVAREARLLGFPRAGSTPLGALERGPFLERWLADGRAGEMGYLARRTAERIDPRTAFPWARSIVSLAYPSRPLPPRLSVRRAGGVSDGPPALHLLSDDRAPGRDPTRAAPPPRQLDLRL